MLRANTRAARPPLTTAGRLSEIPASYLVPRIIGVLGLTGVLWYSNSLLFWNQKPATYDPAFQAEAKKIGRVAVSGPGGQACTAAAAAAAPAGGWR